ncbi:MAG: M20/M25/M40 family metallo-hydrolase [Planctomycetota bacterium]|nr:M20/M25/M40 family metallo-hydrolase [Planctomycetota bacterium]MSR38626.1 M20/M25/M40 family metallo-hydrolase [Planctomycetota bacterium]
MARRNGEETSAAWMLDRLAALCAFDTTTGSEDNGLPALRALLTELGADVSLQLVAPGRHNVFAQWSSAPQILFSTHLDTVPPFIPPTRNGDFLHGRGTCDAKGQLVCQLAAIQSLLAQGHTDVAWLGVVGEETDSIGAQAAVAHFAARCKALRGVVNGEPTENLLATGQRGALQIKLRTRGIPAHSGLPELGRSAIWPMLDWLQRLRGIPERLDAELGPEIWNLGLLRCGEAPNVVPANAEALLFVRALPGCDFATAVQKLAPAEAEVVIVSQSPADRYPTMAGFRHAFVPFGSDAPRLRQLAKSNTVVLVGPGSIRVAHTADECITGADLAAGKDLLIRLGHQLLAERVRIPL